MGFFSSIFGWFKDFFSLVASTAVGMAAESISSAAIDVVKELDEHHSLNGTEKWTRAKRVLSTKYPSVESAAINLAIESALAIVKDKMK